jgi:hypothetical protein
VNPFKIAFSFAIVGNKLLQPKGSLRRGISTSDQNLNRRSFKKKNGNGNAETQLLIQDVNDDLNP